MIHGLSETDKFKVLRPIIGDCDYDIYNMPIIKKTDQKSVDWDSLRAVGIQNLSPKTKNKNALVLMFNYDKRLQSLWNEPLKKIGLLQSCAVIATPDFSVYPGMNINLIQFNVYMNRWLGVTWQNYGCIVIPTVGWAKPDTYDICFSGIEKGSVVVISTLGCQNCKEDFLNGFEEMKKRLEPSLIIVYGEMIDGMTGTFLNIKYKDAFSSKYEQLRIPNVPVSFTIKEVA